ncbi:MAG: PIG-L family deacetylase [Desulfamplus sp.]|nr:PIG-L family deacetylase [Desulfamplus sp.]
MIRFMEQDLIPYHETDLPRGPYIVFAPHPDDESLGMGGTIALAAAKGIGVYVVFMTAGDMGGDSEIRKKEAVRAGEILGIQGLFHLDLGDRKVESSSLPENELGDILKGVMPNTVFLPSFQEIHPDHRATTQKVLDFLEKHSYSCSLWFYEINRQGEINGLIDITSVMEIKEEAIDCYKSQLAQLDYKSQCLCLDYARSITLGGSGAYSEGFWIHAPDAGKDPEILYVEHMGRYFSQDIFRHDKLGTGPSSWEIGQRFLKERLKNQSAVISKLSSLIDVLSGAFNNSFHDMGNIKSTLDDMAGENRYLKERLHEISLSRAHALASAYIKFILFMKNMVRNIFSQMKNTMVRNIFSTMKNTMTRNLFSLMKDAATKGREKMDNVKRISDYPGKNSENFPGDAPGNSPGVPEHSPGGGAHPCDGVMISTFLEPVSLCYPSGAFPSLASYDFSIHEERHAHGMTSVIDIHDGKSVAFPLDINCDDLCCIKLFMAAFQRINPGTLFMEIYKDLRDPLPMRKCEIKAPAILDNAFLSFIFDPISGFKGMTLYVRVGLTGGSSLYCLGLWSRPRSLGGDRQAYHDWIRGIEKKEPIIQLPQGVVSSEGDLHGRMSNLTDPGISVAVIMPFWEHSMETLQGDTMDMIRQSRASLFQQSCNAWHFDSIEQSCQYGELVKIIQDQAKDFFLFIHPLDMLSPDAMHECCLAVSRHPEGDIFYSDEDKISRDAVRDDPFFKPGWSPELQLSFPAYPGGIVMFRTELLGGLTDLPKTHPGEQEFTYDLMLRLTEMAQGIVHIPKILYHKRVLASSGGIKQMLPSSWGMKGLLPSSGGMDGVCQNVKCQAKDKVKYELKCIEDALERRGEKGRVEKGITDNTFRIVYPFDGEPRVSIIIPFRDQPEVLGAAVKSVLTRTSYPNYEIICVDNQSCQPDTLELIADLKKLARVTFMEYDAPFNYAAMNNLASRGARGDVLVFLNADTEVITRDWLQEMLGHACRKSVGAVGAALYFVNDTIQHAGIVLGIAGLAGHAFKHVGIEWKNFCHGLPFMLRDVSAVTGACMMIRTKLFEELGGFDQENFPVSYNDLDLCLRLRQKGYRIIFTPFARLYHYESYSRGYSYDECATLNLRQKWGDVLLLDPFYNPNLTTIKENWSLPCPVNPM